MEANSKVMNFKLFDYYARMLAIKFFSPPTESKKKAKRRRREKAKKKSRKAIKEHQAASARLHCGTRKLSAINKILFIFFLAPPLNKGSRNIPKKAKSFQHFNLIYF
jgi:hypothetical protein